MSRYVALLRGINVGGKNKLPMSDLIAMARDAGGTEVENYIQSGNLVFSATEKVAARLPTLVSAEIERRFGYQVPLLIRNAGDLSRVCRGNPYLRSGADVEVLHVAFLADQPVKSRVESLDPRRSPPDSFTVRGREIYLHCPGGMARTKLTNAYFDSKLATTTTVRNWKTVLKLVEMASI